MDELLTRFLPLVYNIVGRALGQRGDVDDVVQDTMLRVVRGLGGLRDPERFRSWLVAVTMNQVREYRQYRHGGSAVPLEDTHDLADPGADFVDLTLTQLGLSGQRREVAQATCWLDADDRDLLSLWWLEAAGHLTRADLVTALQLNPHLVTVRIARMKGQLELARLVVRALTANPGCPQLAELAGNWPGEPTPLWRKRFARHIRECRYCPSAEAEFVPAERLLAGLSLVPLPSGYSPLPAGLGHFASSPVVRMEPTRRLPAHRAKPRGLRHLSAQLATKPLLGVGVVALVTALSLVAVYLPSQGRGTNTSAGNTPSSAAAVQPSSSVVALPSVTATPGTSASPSASSTPSAAPTPTASPTPSKAATTKPAAPPATKKPTPPSPPTGSQSAADQVLNLINQTRAQQGLPAYTVSSGLVSSAAAHTQVMAGGCGLSHQCPGEAALGDRETAAGVHWTSAGENIGDGGPEADTTSAIAQMAVGLTQDMINEQPPDDGHRLNILSSSFTHIGIVVYRDSSGTVWMTQDFSN